MGRIGSDLRAWLLSIFSFSFTPRVDEKLGPKIHIDSSDRIVALSHVIELLSTGDFFATYAAKL
jgi:hypothetical protein